MKICKIQGCGKIYYGQREYCPKHYSHLKKYGNPLKYLRIVNPLKTKYCKIEGCNKKHYARGYCPKHYQFYKLPVKYGHKHKCNARHCLNLSYKKYCYPHRERIRRNLPLDLSINCNILRMRGKHNPNWKGGIAEYPNHSLMKKNRLIILLNNPKCEICGKPATEIHHKDFSKNNHKLSNLQAVCHKCNLKRGSKYYQKYGMTLNEIASKLGRTTTYWWNHQNQLSSLLTNELK